MRCVSKVSFLYNLVTSSIANEVNEKVITLIIEKNRDMALEIEFVKNKQEEISGKLDELTNMITSNFARLFKVVGRLAISSGEFNIESNNDHHRKKIETNLKTVPCISAEQLASLDVLLQDQSLSISLVIITVVLRFIWFRFIFHLQYFFKLGFLLN